MWNIAGKTVVITGGTSGIGKETVKALSASGAKVCFTARNEDKGKRVKDELISLTGNKNIDFMYCDLSSFASVKSLAKSVMEKYSEVRVLINNAGTWNLKRRITADGVELTMQVNYFSPALLMLLMKPVLKRGAPSRIINVSSAAHHSARLDIEDLNMKKHYNSITAYANSKLALILFTKKLAEITDRRETTVNAVHPGLVRTGLFNSFPRFIVRLVLLNALTPEQGARTTIYLATSDEVSGITGEYFANCKVAQPSSRCFDGQLKEGLYLKTIEMLGKYLD